MYPRHVYVHVPFCARRCAYCDFSIAVRRVVPVDDYASALARELTLRFPEPLPWLADTLYLGGGTPSILGGEGIVRVMETLRARIVIEPGAEVTIEANPDDVTARAAARWTHAGVNRMSLGAQSFSTEALSWMHRTHDAPQIERAIGRAREAGIENISLDLIFALPEGVRPSWREDLEAAIALSPDHVSLYGLTVHERTPLARWMGSGAIREAPDERYAEEFLMAHEALVGEGYDHYEVSSYARPGRRSRHNDAYWSGSDYAGLGPSAHELVGDRRRWNLSPYTHWLEALRTGRDPVAGEESLSEANRAAERVYLGLRTGAGLAVTPGERDHVRRWVAEGWGALEADRFRLTPEGWLRLDALAADLTAFTSRY